MNTLLETKNLSDIKSFHDDIFLCDAARDCTVVSSRSDGSRSMGESLFNIIDTKTRDMLRERLFSFDTTPFTINTKIGKATVYNSLLHSSLLFIVQFKKNGDAKHIECLMSETMLSVCPSTNELCAKALEVSEMCGCPIGISICESEYHYSEYDQLFCTFDMPLYVAFLTSLLLLSRHASKERRAEIIIKA